MAFNSVDLPPSEGGGGLDQQSCRLLGATALIVQGLMGIIVLGSLLYKRQRESPKRPWAIWMFDVSKQVIGQMFIHGVNVLISDVASHLEAGNACTYYFLNILVDTTLGVGILYAILHLLTRLFSEGLHLKGFESGQYGSPPSFKYWVRQTGVYVAALTTMKFVIIGLFLLWPGIFAIGTWLIDLLGEDEHVQVVFTMGLFPIIMNVVQFWLIDSIVKASDGNWYQSASRIFIAGPDAAPLFASGPDDEDDEGNGDEEAQRTRRSDPGGSRDARSSSIPAPAGHSYPPSSSRPPSPPQRVPAGQASPSLAMTTSAPSPSLGARRKGSLPTPLLPRSPMVPAINSPDTEKLPWGDWDAAGGDDDWAARIGEEDWTGRRLEARRIAVRDVWT
ncbi:vacuolar membrane protein-domain-containing protein [Vararia minispora EC-137]|uniref:Vacuolar membrane protein-domain-containing protein n=1 Tax=Vararia minispora EC-137 TaxID=1314806 RepID=A0ACB8QGF9_9AGAM|nr:vacuolar membrane protein-domain-containing protein [Vararia minispora EC-137]